MAAYSATAWPSSFLKILVLENLSFVNNGRYPGTVGYDRKAFYCLPAVLLISSSNESAV
jgi:hypothetical protein